MPASCYQTTRAGYCRIRALGVSSANWWVRAWQTSIRSKGALCRSGSRGSIRTASLLQGQKIDTVACPHWAYKAVRRLGKRQAPQAHTYR
ncbi:MAG: hypothetical protein ACLPUX_00705 [Syntrophobacteraceae bacterium]